MIYFFYGTDIEKRNEAREKIARSFESITHFSDVDWDKEKFENIARSGSLFSPSELIILENVLENAEAKDFIFDHLDTLKDSENTFIFLEKKALKDTVTKFTKKSKEVKEFAGAKSKEYKADVFAITYPFEKRDKKNMWLEFQKLKETDTKPEALSGILFWKIKDMILKGNFRNWSEQELKNLSSRLVSLHHDAHRGLINFEVGLEKFIIDSL